MTSHKLRWIAVSVVALSGGLAAPRAVAVAAPAPTLLVSGSQIDGIDATSTSLVWRRWSATTRNGASCASVFRSRNWSSGATTTLFRCDPLKPQDETGETALGTAGLAFTRTYYEANGCCDSEIDTQLRTAAKKGIDSSFHQIGCTGDTISGLAAHGALAAYSKGDWTSTYCPGNPDTGTATLTGGVIRTLALPSGNARTMLGAPVSKFIALSTQHIVLVPFDVSAGTINALPPPLPQLQVWNIHSRSLERTIAENGTIEALAFSGDEIAVMVKDGAGDIRIDRFSASTGMSTGSTHIAATAAPMLTIYYRWIVYAVGRTITGLDTTDGSTHVIAQPTYAPEELVAVRGQVVWLAHGDRVLALPLP